MAKKKGKTAQMPTVLPPRTKEDELEDLLNEFRACVDETIIMLIHEESGYEEAHKALSNIAENVVQEENSGFDPSGLQNIAASSSADIVNSSDASSSSRVESGGNVCRPSSHTTTAPSDLGNGHSPALILSKRSSSYGDSRGSGMKSSIDSSDLLDSLRVMFPDLKEHDIKDAMKKGDNDLETISDLLLNVMHLEETSQRPKGVDGFFADDDSNNTHLGSKKRGRNGRQKQPKNDQLPVYYKLKPTTLDDEEDTDSGTSKQQASLSSPMLSAEDQRQNLALMQHFRESGSQSYESARALFRRGNSDPLYRQAATVYTERSQQHHIAARILGSRHSDSIVDGQSSGNKIDLHQVPVQDGVRNALARTQLWWTNLGEDSIRKARENPLQIVTGIGRHSTDGSSRMYSHVGRALREAGWKVQDGFGHYIITGKKI